MLSERSIKTNKLDEFYNGTCKTGLRAFSGDVIHCCGDIIYLSFHEMNHHCVKEVHLNGFNNLYALEDMMKQRDSFLEELTENYQCSENMFELEFERGTKSCDDMKKLMVNDNCSLRDNF